MQCMGLSLVQAVQTVRHGTSAGGGSSCHDVLASLSTTRENMAWAFLALTDIGPGDQGKGSHQRLESGVGR